MSKLVSARAVLFAFVAFGIGLSSCAPRGNADSTRVTESGERLVGAGAAAAFDGPR